MKLSRNDECWCGSKIKYKHCHLDFDEELEEYKCKGFTVPSHKIIKTQGQLDGIRESGKINNLILDTVSNMIKEGVSTQEIDDLVAKVTAENGAVAAPLNFMGYPKSVCVSVNSQVCHGIPCKDDILKNGDIVNVDVSTIYNGYFSDSSRMFMIGDVSEQRQKLTQAAHQAVFEGLKQVKPWTPMGNMGQAVNDYVKSQGFSVVQEVGGHGVGIEFHEDPYVSYVSSAGTGMLMVPGMVFTIEPMINAGSHKIFVDKENDWTIYTADGSDSAQWEVTVAITNDGYEIMAH